MVRRRALVAAALVAAALSVPTSRATADLGCGPLAITPPAGQWLDGDTHVHTDHSSDGSGPRQGSDDRLPGNTGVADQIGQAERVGLDFLPLTDHRTYDQHYDPAWTSSKLLLIPGEEANGGPHATVHGAIEQVPDGPNPPGSAEFRHFQQSIWDVHAQDASWSTAHPDDGEVDDAGLPNGNAGAVGVDTVEIFNGPPASYEQPGTDVVAIRLAYAENRWNNGWRFGVVAASDNHFKELWPIAGPGQPRTRVFASSLSERGVLDALRAGRTSISAVAGGPMVTLVTHGAMGGDEVRVPAGGCVRLRVTADLAVGNTVRLVSERGVVATYPVTLPSQVFDLPVTVPAGHHWYRADVVAPTGTLLATATPLFTYSDAPAVPQSPLPPRHAEGDGAVPIAAMPGVFTGFPDVAFARGRTHVVYERHDAAGATKVLYGGGVDLAPGSSAARFPRVAASGRDVWVVWEDERSGQMPRRPDVYLRHSADGGETWDEEQLLTSGDGRAIRPVVAVGRDGVPVVAWSSNAGGAVDVYVKVGDAEPVNVSSAGKVVVPASPLDTRSARYPASVTPALAVSPATGAVTVAWADNRLDVDPGWTGTTGVGEGTAPDDWEVFAFTLGDDELVNLSRTETRADRLPSIAYTDAGELVAAWESKELREAGVPVEIRTSTSSLPLAADGAAMFRRPRLGAGEDGAVDVVWYDTLSSDWRYRVRRATYNGDGAWSPAAQVSGTGNGTFPAVSGGRVAFVSDRSARVQHDRTSGVYLVK